MKILVVGLHRMTRFVPCTEGTKQPRPSKKPLATFVYKQRHRSKLQQAPSMSLLRENLSVLDNTDLDVIYLLCMVTMQSRARARTKSKKNQKNCFYYPCISSLIGPHVHKPLFSRIQTSLYVCLAVPRDAKVEDTLLSFGLGLLFST